MIVQKDRIAAGERVDADVMPWADLNRSRGVCFVRRDDGVYLLGSRSASSGVAAFPARPLCPQTGAADMQPAEFGPTATLYSFSTVHVSARQSVPYTLGYIDFPTGLRVLATVRGAVEAMHCDQPVRLNADAQSWWVEPIGGER